MAIDTAYVCTNVTKANMETRLRHEPGSLAYNTDTGRYGAYDLFSNTVIWRTNLVEPIGRYRPAWFERSRSTGININDLMDAWETEKTAKIFKEDIDELL